MSLSTIKDIKRTPELGFFDASSEGTIQVADDGKLRFEPQPGGKHKQLKIVEEKRLDLMKHYIEMASAKPPAPQQRNRPTPAAIEQKKAAEAAKPAAK